MSNSLANLQQQQTKITKTWTLGQYQHVIVITTEKKRIWLPIPWHVCHLVLWCLTVKVVLEWHLSAGFFDFPFPSSSAEICSHPETKGTSLQSLPAEQNNIGHTHTANIHIRAVNRLVKWNPGARANLNGYPKAPHSVKTLIKPHNRCT